MRRRGFHPWVCALTLLFALNVFAELPTPDPAADKAWSELQTAMKPKPPKEWEQKEPTDAEQKAFAIPKFLQAADFAHNFYTKFPQDKRADEAKFFEMRALKTAEQMGSTNATARLQKLQQNSTVGTNTSSDNDVVARFNELQHRAQAMGEFGSPGFTHVMLNGLAELRKEYPNRPDLAQLTVQIASMAEPDKARPALKEIADSNVPPQIKEEAKSMLEKLDLIGKPLEIKFKAVDGRDVDVQNMKGKVVLVDFWATWCMPCVGEIPHVKEAYAALHDKGFDVVGISLDEDKSKLTSFVSEQKMPWPQYFDGKQWQNEIVLKYGIHSIPAMWLVDKKGNLRDINARVNLKGKVEKLLAEK